MKSSEVRMVVTPHLRVFNDCLKLKSLIMQRIEMKLSYKGSFKKREAMGGLIRFLCRSEVVNCSRAETLNIQ